MNTLNLADILRNHIPTAIIPYCLHLHEQLQFQFKVTRNRKSKLGDFRVDVQGHTTITINGGLNTYSFLITYLHEVAHAIVFQKHKWTVKPHGKEWKHAFSMLLRTAIAHQVFPKDIEQEVQRYQLNPAASTAGSPTLYSVLKNYDTPEVLGAKIQLLELQRGDQFILHQRVFSKGDIRRTRIVCTELKTKKKYTVPAHALVEKV